MKKLVNFIVEQIETNEIITSKLNNTMKAYGYLRVSTDAQAKDSAFGLEDQKEEIDQWAKENGYEIVKFYIDDGYSGTTQNRPKLQTLLGDIEKGESRPVIVAKMDRWARDTFLHLFLEKELVKHDSKLLSVSEDSLNESNPANDLLRKIMMAFADFEAQRITARMAGGRKQKAKSGGISSGRIPLGYKKNANGEIVIDHEEAKVVKDIFQFRDLDYSLRKIAGILNAHDIKTKAGNKWSAKSVSYILKNDKYKGLLNQKVQGESIQSENENLKIID